LRKLGEIIKSAVWQLISLKKQGLVGNQLAYSSTHMGLAAK